MSLMTAYPAGLALHVAGNLQLFVFLFFLRPGAGFRSWAPIWRASRNFYPAGVALWVSSSILMLVGGVLLLVQSNAPSCVP